MCCTLISWQRAEAQPLDAKFLPNHARWRLSLHCSPEQQHRNKVTAQPLHGPPRAGTSLCLRSRMRNKTICADTVARKSLPRLEGRFSAGLLSQVPFSRGRLGVQSCQEKPINRSLQNTAHVPESSETLGCLLPDGERITSALYIK